VTGRIRVVVAEQVPGPDARVPGLARALRDAGMEVIYTGPVQTPEQIVLTALQEDADVIGLSVGAGSAQLAKLVELLARRDAEDVLVFAAEPGGPAEPGGSGPESGSPGGSGPESDGPGGVTVFGPGTSPARIAAWVRDRLRSP
jgi:methylmalonyl-CoA mutase C-terminal domain/subunit